MRFSRFSLRRNRNGVFYCCVIFFIIFLIIFAFSRNKPEESHSYGATNQVIDPYAYPVLINPMIPACSNPNSTKNIVIIVHTHPKNDNRRSRIRSTMGNETLKNFIGFDIVFAMGKPENESLQVDVDQEAAQYGDILQADFADTYWNLTTKAIVWIKYLAENCVNKNPFIVKVDDDAVFDLVKMKNVLCKNAKELENNYYCQVWNKNSMPIIRNNNNSKWYVPESEMSLSLKYYDAYCSGMGYLTSSTVIMKQWNYLVNHKVHFHKIDDFFVTGKLAAEANVNHINGPGEFQMVSNVTNSLESNGIFFVCHNSEHQPLIWKHICENSLKKAFGNNAIIIHC